VVELTNSQKYSKGESYGLLLGGKMPPFDLAGWCVLLRKQPYSKTSNGKCLLATCNKPDENKCNKGRLEFTGKTLQKIDSSITVFYFLETDRNLLDISTTK